MTSFFVFDHFNVLKEVSPQQIDLLKIFSAKYLKVKKGQSIIKSQRSNIVKVKDIQIDLVGGMRNAMSKMSTSKCTSSFNDES